MVFYKSGRIKKKKKLQQFKEALGQPVEDLEQQKPLRNKEESAAEQVRSRQETGRRQAENRFGRQWISHR